MRFFKNLNKELQKHIENDFGTSPPWKIPVPKDFLIKENVLIEEPVYEIFLNENTLKFNIYYYSNHEQYRSYTTTLINYKRDVLMRGDVVVDVAGYRHFPRLEFDTRKAAQKFIDSHYTKIMKERKYIADNPPMIYTPRIEQ